MVERVVSCVIILFKELEETDKRVYREVKEQYDSKWKGFTVVH